MDRMGAKGILVWVRGRLSSSGGQLHLKRDGKCSLAGRKACGTVGQSSFRSSFY